MIPAERYLLHHSMQRQGVKKLLQKNRQKIKYTDKQKVIDIGCGPGDITHEFLLPFIPEDGELVGCDVSKSMIDIAEVLCRDFRSSFKTMDISKSEVVEYYESYFDTAYAFFACIGSETKAAMQNIYSILKPGGEYLSLSVVDTVVYPIYEILAASPKWSPYMLNFKEAIPLYRDSADPVADVRNLMEDVGFQVDECSLGVDFHGFSSKELFGEWMDAINPFLKNVPAHLINEFREENIKLAFCGDLCTLNETTNEVSIKYTKITVFARKL